MAYLRFSDENSNPRSLDQQLLNVLNHARREGMFVPWCYVLADAAVSGTLACRTGHMLATTLVERREESGVAWFLIDNLSRTSRNTIESLRLGELAEATGVRVVGASDGYDSANPQASLLLPVLGSMNEAFITQLRSKVNRGMDDAFRRGDNVSPPGVGYRLVDVKDAYGNLVITPKNTIEKAVEIDPEAADWMRRGPEIIAHEGKSATDVARLFNEHKVGGKQTWDDRGGDDKRASVLYAEKIKRTSARRNSTCPVISSAVARRHKRTRSSTTCPSRRCLAGQKTIPACGLPALDSTMKSLSHVTNTRPCA